MGEEVWEALGALAFIVVGGAIILGVMVGLPLLGFIMG